VYPGNAKNKAGSNRGPGHLSLSKAMSVALPNAELASLGLPSLIGPLRTAVWEGGGAIRPLIPIGSLGPARE